jgi:hypothetical protein
MKRCRRNLHDYNTKQCMVCEKAWRLLHKDELKEKKKKWDLDNRQSLAAKQKISRAKKRDYYLAKQKEYRTKNRAKRTALENKRRAAKLQRTPKWLTKQHFLQMDLFYEAANSLTKELGIRFEVDHIVPLLGKNSSGLHVPWNLQVITKAENMSKGNR